MTEPASCAALADTLAEVATGAGTGPDRAQVLSHAMTCESCRRELEELSRVADEVLLIAPAHEPPAGFEGTVLDRISQLSEPARTGRTRRARPYRAGPRRADLPRAGPRRRLVLAVAAALIALAGAGAAGAGTAWLATSDDRQLAESYRETLDVADGRYFSATPLRDAAGSEVGHVFLYQGEPSWIFVTVGRAPAPGSYDLVVTTAVGSSTVASCSVDGTACSAGAAVDTNIYQISRITLVSPTGATLTATR